MTGGDSVSCPRTFILLQTDGQSEVLTGLWEAVHQWLEFYCWMWVTTAASSANSMSLLITLRTFVLALSLRPARLKSLPSDRVRRYIPYVVVSKACFSTRPKKISKSVGARTQPCLTPLRISNGSEELPLNCTVPFVSNWTDSIMLCSLGGQPIFWRTLKRPSLLTRSNALVRTAKATYKGICCSLHFSCSCRREKTMSIVDRSARKPHCDSGKIRSASFWSQISMTRANTLPTMLSREMPL